MTRYFVDTNCLLGLTFINDRWCPDAKRLFDTDNTIYTGKNAVYEYCSSTEGNSRRSADIRLDRDEGLYGEKRAKLRLKLRQFGKMLQTYSDDELDIETVMDEYVERFDMKESEEKEVRPRLQKYFEWYFEKEGELTRRTAREAARKLKDVLMERSIKHKDQIEARVYLEPIRDREYPEVEKRLKEWPVHMKNNADIALICDAVFLKEEIGISHFVTGDFTDIYSNQDWIHENLGFSVLYLLETFAGEEAPTASIDLDN